MQVDHLGWSRTWLSWPQQAYGSSLCCSVPLLSRCFLMTSPAGSHCRKHLLEAAEPAEHAACVCSAAQHAMWMQAMHIE